MPTKKTTKTKEEHLEEQIDTIEINLNKAKKVGNNIKKEKRTKNTRKKKTEEKIIIIREDLKNQLISQNKFGEHFNDMIENYLFYVRLKEDLQYDIDAKGIRYEARTGNGYKTDKPNESVKNLINVTTEMRKILQDLDLKEPEESPEAGEGDDLL